MWSLFLVPDKYGQEGGTGEGRFGGYSASEEGKQRSSANLKSLPLWGGEQHDQRGGGGRDGIGHEVSSEGRSGGVKAAVVRQEITLMGLMKKGMRGVRDPL